MEKGDCLAYPPHPHEYGASHLVILEGCISPDRPAGGWGLSCILVPFFNVERMVLIPVATIKTRDTIEAAKLTSLMLCISILSNFIRIISTWVIPPPPPFVCSYILGNVPWQCRNYKPIVPFVRRCASSLQDLIFDKLPLRPLSLAEILTLLRKLRHLTIHEPTVSLLNAYYPHLGGVPVEFP